MNQHQTDGLTVECVEEVSIIVTMQIWVIMMALNLNGLMMEIVIVIVV